jgi:hypothetical protein
MESANDTSNRVGAAAPTSLISSHEKRFHESFCVHAPRLVVRPATLGISGWALWGLLRNLSLPNSSKTQILILCRIHVQRRQFGTFRIRPSRWWRCKREGAQASDGSWRGPSRSREWPPHNSWDDGGWMPKAGSSHGTFTGLLAIEVVCNRSSCPPSHAFTASSLKRLFNHQILFQVLWFIEHQSNSIAPCSLLCNPNPQIPVWMLMASSLLIFTFSPHLQKLPSSTWNASPARLSAGVWCAMNFVYVITISTQSFRTTPISSLTLIAQRRIQPCTVIEAHDLLWPRQWARHFRVKVVGSIPSGISFSL